LREFFTSPSEATLIDQTFILYEGLDYRFIFKNVRNENEKLVARWGQ
jgi:hypothetical protein